MSGSVRHDAVPATTLELMTHRFLDSFPSQRSCCWIWKYIGRSHAVPLSAFFAFIVLKPKDAVYVEVQ